MAASGGVQYQRRAGDSAVLYRAVEDALSELLDVTDSVGGLPRFLLREVHAYLRCGVLAHGFVRVRCDTCDKELLVAFSCKSRGLCPSCSARRSHETAAHLVENVLPHVPYRQWTVSFPFPLRWRLMKEKGLLEAFLRETTRLVFAWQRRAAKKSGVVGHLLTGAVTQVQYFGSALQLSPHFHALVPDGVFVENAGAVSFVELTPPTAEEVATLVQRLARRVKKQLRRRGLEDAQPDCEDGLDALRLESLNESFKLGVVSRAPSPPARRGRVAMADGISLHADTWVHANDRQSLERLARYGARGPLAACRLSRRDDGLLEYKMKRSVAGRELLVLSPLQLLKKLAAVCPPKGKPLIHFHGVFAPNAHHRAAVVAFGRPPRPAPVEPQTELPFTGTGIAKPPPSPPRLNWAALLRRTFGLELLVCPCGGRRTVLAAVTDCDAIDAELSARGLASRPRQHLRPRSHGPPRQAELFAA